MRIEDKDERDFYEKEAMRSGWNVSTLKRQYHSSLYERLALSRDKDSVLRLANEGAVPQRPEDILHTPYVLEYERIEGENPTIGILLCKESDEALVDLTLPKDTNIYAKEYKFYLPDKNITTKIKRMA